MLIAEDFLLLVTDDETGRLSTTGTQTDVALGGALLVELTLSGHVGLADAGERVREGGLVVRDNAPTGDLLLDEALSQVAGKEGKKPESVVVMLGKGTRARLYDRLVERGLVRTEEGRILGLFPRHRWPATDGGHEADVRDMLVTSLRTGVAADARTGALISLLLALGTVHKVVDPDSLGLSRRELDSRAQQIAESEWAGSAVRSAIRALNAAITAAITAVVITGASGGS